MSSPEILSPVSSPRVENGTFHTSNVFLTNSFVLSPRNSDRVTCNEIQSLLKLQPKKYIIVENTDKHTSHCWETFGFPGIVHENANSERIDDFVSCKKCLITYSFVSNSTRLLNQYRCNVSLERRKRLEVNDGSSTKRHLNRYFSNAIP